LVWKMIVEFAGTLAANVTVVGRGLCAIIGTVPPRTPRTTTREKIFRVRFAITEVTVS
jgi:hypothetical protein